MDSINQQQPEENRQDLAGKEAIAKIRDLVEEAGNCFFCTNISTGQPFHTRPMAVQEVDDAGRLWFLSAVDSHKNDEVLDDPMVQLLFKGSGHSDMLMLYGRASVSADKERIEALWKPIMKTWFTGGKDDPRIRVIAVDPINGYYWDTKHNRAVAFAKMVAGAITGKTLDDSIEGRLKV